MDASCTSPGEDLITIISYDLINYFMVRLINCIICYFQGIQNRFSSAVNRQFHADAKQMLTDELEGASPDKRAVNMSEDEKNHKVR